MSVFVILGLLVCTLATGSSAANPVFVKTGKDLNLNVMKAVPLKMDDVFVWKFNGDSSVVRYFPDREPIVSPNYSGRIDVTGENFSLKLKNPTKADSGVYTAQITGEENVRVAEYNVTVQDPVSPVELRVDSASESSDSCNVTVTCSTQDSHINSTFTCDTKTCSQEGGEQSEVTTSGASLHVYVTDGFITCNHSNQVSQTEDRKMAEHLCTQREGSQFVPAGVSVCQVKTVVFSVGLVIMVSAVITVHVMEKLKSKKQTSDAPPTNPANISHS